MIYNKIIKLKKYLFLISIVFFIVSLTHLIYTYIYNDTKLVPIKGWTVSEWLIWNFPSLNPLKQLSWNNKYLVWLLYRSMLKYDSQENKIVWDLATCDISNLLNIECYLSDNIFWSNWEPITVDDIIATYDIIKNTWINKIYSSLLNETEIIKNENTITFKNTQEDINFLNIFFQPILNKKIIDSLSQEIIFWNFPTEWQLYSWNFKISNVNSDLTVWITKIYLDPSEYSYKWNIWKLIINIFPNINSLLQNKETINIYNDVDNIIGDSIPRLQSKKYILPQYVSLFINQNNIDNLNLRNYILEKINTTNLLKLLWENKFIEIFNPYLTDISIRKEIKEKNFEKIMSNLWYVKKSKIIENFISWNNSWTGSNETNNIEKNIEEKISELKEENLTIDKFQSDSKFIILPEYVDRYNFITKDNTLLTWKIDGVVDAIYINDYKLNSYTKWSNNFYYRLRESYNTLKPWINNYKIYFEEKWEKILKEELTFVYYNNKQTLETEKTKFIRNLYEEEIKKQIEENNKKHEETKKIVKSEEKQEIKKELTSKIDNLDEKFYYNDKLEKFKLNLYYLSSEKEIEKTASFIRNTLLEIWIDTILFPIWLDNLKEIIYDKNKYDMILSWLNLSIFDYNIFPYFHSSQAKSWYNFSNIKKTSLDILLEDLKSEIKTQEEIKEIQNKILEILKNEQVIKTLYTPQIDFLIDKNFKNIILPNRLLNKSSRKVIYDNILVREEKILNLENKSIFNFFSFLLNKLNE